MWLAAESDGSFNPAFKFELLGPDDSSSSSSSDSSDSSDSSSGASSGDSGSSCGQYPLCEDITTDCESVSVSGLSAITPVASYLKTGTSNFSGPHGPTPIYQVPAAGTSTDSVTLEYDGLYGWTSTGAHYYKNNSRPDPIRPNPPRWLGYGYYGFPENGTLLLGVDLRGSIDTTTGECVYSLWVGVSRNPKFFGDDQIIVTGAQYVSTTGINGTYSLQNDPADGGNIYRQNYNPLTGLSAGRTLEMTVPMTLDVSCGAASTSAPPDSSSSESTDSSSDSSSSSSSSSSDSSSSDSSSDSSSHSSSGSSGGHTGPGGGSGSEPGGGSSSEGSGGHGGSSSGPPTTIAECCPAFTAVFGSGCTGSIQRVVYTSDDSSWGGGAPVWNGNYGPPGSSKLSWSSIGGGVWTLTVSKGGRLVNKWKTRGLRNTCPPIGIVGAWAPSGDNSGCNLTLLDIVCTATTGGSGSTSPSSSSSDTTPVDETDCSTAIVVPSLPYTHTATVDDVGIWFKYTPARNCGGLKISTCNTTTTINVDMRIFSDCVGGGQVADVLTCLVGSLHTKEITSDVLAGHPVYVLVRAKTSGATGTVKVNWSGSDCDAGGTTAPVVGDGVNVIYDFEDSATSGSWIGVYGADGYEIPNITGSLPSYVSAFTLSVSAEFYNWASPTTDTRALQVPGDPTTRNAATWFSDLSFDFNITFNDTAWHRVAIYVLDWEGIRTTQRQTGYDATTSGINDQRTIALNGVGRWFIYWMRRDAKVTFDQAPLYNSIVAGVFFGTPSDNPDGSGTTDPCFFRDAEGVNCNLFGTWTKSAGGTVSIGPNDSNVCTYVDSGGATGTVTSGSGTVTFTPDGGGSPTTASLTCGDSGFGSTLDFGGVTYWTRS